ncbi:sigma-70 family RNA polymerase sigma factor [Streptomyces sp. SR27]|uniref:sigma-70 family RNA polymerase sigma factor n=1 Tax=Streptomyces sp. SR27 TaxID=3076630 RepID=UPI00295A5F94|nr:sigma-70 family RNA polymerase sigma factor [Streptomyces sp. SR27]MDV9186811.1 sigma-70 family RNA polymerase sigma factor [Streptomyces sp. SR27]
MTDDDSYRRVLGAPPTDLTSEALNQWNEVAAAFGSIYWRVRSWVGRTYADDVMAKAKENFHGHLRRNGPVSGVPRTYFERICRNEANDHFNHLKKLAEDFICDDTSLEAREKLQSALPVRDDLTPVEVHDQLRKSLAVLRKELAPRELTVFVLSKAYEFDSGTIAEYTGSTSGAVRQTLRRANKKLQDPALKRRLALFRLVAE